MSEPIDHELEILRECAGLKPARSWGAAVGAALEVLRGRGFVDLSGRATDKGLRFLEQRGELASGLVRRVGEEE